jgi:ABC-type Mn2+/Zn2+ transport system permease subunit
LRASERAAARGKPLAIGLAHDTRLAPVRVGNVNQLVPLAASAGAALTVGLVFHLRWRRDVGEDRVVGTVCVGLFALGVVLALVGWFPHSIG